MAETTVRIMCPKLTCRKVLAVPTACRGKTVRCKSCGTNTRVPIAQPNSTPPKDSTKAA